MGKRREDATRLAEQGMTVSAIAATMGIGEETARRYLRKDNRTQSSRPWLLFGDLHAPYTHRLAIQFLQHVHRRYGCRKHVYCTGDLMDYHSMSRHTTELDAASPEEEYERAKECVRNLTEAFPYGTVVLGNHDCIPQRQMKEAGLSTTLLKTHNELYNLPDTWKVEPLYAVIPEIDLLVEHGIGSMGANGAINSAVAKCSNYAQGHAHSFAGVSYRASHFTLRYAVNTGCLADNTSLAMRYGRYAKNKGVLGAAVVFPATKMVGEHAIFVPMNTKGEQ